MKKILFFLSAFTSIAAFGQGTIKCLSKEAIDYQEHLTPGFKNTVEQQFQTAKAWKSSNIQKTDPLYTIPVVVHVVYNTAAQNIPDSVIMDQIAVLNEDYNRTNADTTNMRSLFQPIAGSPRIKFVLAGIDPSGNPTTGITRTQTSTVTFGGIGIFTGSFTDLEKIKSTANGGQDPWDQTRYLNIWVGNMAIDLLGTQTVALLGYATPPANLPNWPAGSTPALNDGVVIEFECFGRNNPNPLMMNGVAQEVLGRTVSHEVGHYLGLRHIWGDGDCTQEDGIDDTPNADSQSDFDCDDTRNTCTDNIGTLGDLPDMIENYMDYSAESCQNSFTKGQVELMHGVLEGPRHDLVYNNVAAIEDKTISTMKVYPNPVTHLLTVDISTTANNLFLLDAQGRQLQEIKANHHQLQIDFSGYDAGVYFLRTGEAQQINQMQRIIKM